MFKIQAKLIGQLKKILFENTHIVSAILLGSIGRKNPVRNSDIYISILVDKGFNTSVLKIDLKRIFSYQVRQILHIAQDNKVILYLNNSPKCELLIRNKIQDLSEPHLRSEIKLQDISDSILFDKSNNVFEHLIKISDLRTRDRGRDREREINNLIDRFLYEFERCSFAHRRCDSYQFYFYYNLALQVAVQLSHFSKGYLEFNFLPKNFSTDILPRHEQEAFFNLAGTLYLSAANLQKRKILDFFYHSLNLLIDDQRKLDIHDFCEIIYNRDLLWNFRDISFYNSKIKEKILYRTSSFTFIQNEPSFENIISEIGLKTIIDLRAENEITKSQYGEKSLKLLNWVVAPFNHYTLTQEFKDRFKHKTAIETEYFYFALECKSAVKKAIGAILKEENPIAIHCEAGKKRTGVFVTLLHLLSKADTHVIYEDFLASEMDTRKEYLDVVFDIINQNGGIENYLYSCDLTQQNVLDLKQLILINN